MKQRQSIEKTNECSKDKATHPSSKPKLLHLSSFAPEGQIYVGGRELHPLRSVPPTDFSLESLAIGSRGITVIRL